MPQPFEQIAIFLRSPRQFTKFEIGLLEELAVSVMPEAELGAAKPRPGQFERGLIVAFLELHRKDGSPIPEGVIGSLVSAFRSVDLGLRHPLFEPQHGGEAHRPSRTFAANLVIDCAVAYRLAVAAGSIADGNPIKTIHAAFGGNLHLTERAIRQWVSERRESVVPLDPASADRAIELLRMAGLVYSHRLSTRAREGLAS